MPLYEYQCKKCGKVFEVLQRASTKPLFTIHENCGGALERLVSTSAFQFKGTGWYATDYAKGSKGKAAAEGSSKKKEESKDDSSKPAGDKAPSTPAKPPATKS